MRAAIRRLLESAGFSPKQLFAALQGAWLEPTPGYIWQENTGVTPTTTGGQTIGLMLDQSRGLNSANAYSIHYGVTASRIYTPDAPASRVAGDITIIGVFTLSVLTPAAQTALVSKRATTPAYGWSLNIGVAGPLTFACAIGGVNTTYSSSVNLATAGVSVGVKTWIRVVRTASTGTTVFSFSTNGITWTQIGTDRTGTAGNIDYDASPVEVGYRSFSALTFTGFCHGATVAGSTGVVVHYDPARYTGGSTLSSATGETWTLEGSVNIVPEGNHASQATAANRPTYQLDSNNLPLARHDATDNLVVSLPNLGSGVYSASGSVYFSTPVGMSALHGQSMGTTYQLPALSTDIYSWMVFPQRLSAAQESRLARYMDRRAGIAGPDYLLDNSDNQLTADDGEQLLLAQ